MTYRGSNQATRKTYRLKKTYIDLQDFLQLTVVTPSLICIIVYVCISIWCWSKLRPLTLIQIPLCKDSKLCKWDTDQLQTFNNLQINQTYHWTEISTSKVKTCVGKKTFRCSIIRYHGAIELIALRKLTCFTSFFISKYCLNRGI